MGAAFNGMEQPFYSSEAGNPNGTDTFTLRLQNNTTTPTQIDPLFSPASQILGPCGDVIGETVWNWTAKVGSTDITSRLANGTYVTPVLTKGKYVAITLAVKIPQIYFEGCGSNWFTIQTNDEVVILSANAVRS